MGALSPSGPPPSVAATPTSSLSSWMLYLVLSLKLHLHRGPTYNTLFPLLLPSFAFFFKAQLNASSSRKPSWIYPLGFFSWSELPQDRSRTTPRQHVMWVCVLVALPASLMSSDSVSSLKTEMFV